MWLADLEAVRSEWDNWNHAVQRSMGECAAHPTAACRGADGVGAARVVCDQLAETDSLFCYKHERERSASAKRMRAVRRAADQQRYRDRAKEKT